MLVRHADQRRPGAIETGFDQPQRWRKSKDQLKNPHSPCKAIGGWMIRPNILQTTDSESATVGWHSATAIKGLDGNETMKSRNPAP